MSSWVEITKGMRGYFAVLVGKYKSPKYGEFIEPIRSGIGSYDSYAAAIPEAKDWARAEEVEFKEKKGDRP